MEYRRFGKTGLDMPVISCGGMRFQHSWKSGDPVPDESQRTVEGCVRKAFDLGINHFETARGYGTSEYQLGQVLPDLPREEIIVQTKVGPMEDPEKFEEVFNKCMELLNMDYVELFAFHGVNTDELVEWVQRCWGKIEGWKKAGRIGHVGFSTHAATDVITRAIETDLFDYVNIHWYYVFQDNWPAIEAARARDMGVFIISPNDKGGKLYAPSEKLVELTAPVHPMVFNGLYCLSHPEVHTLSCGVSCADDFDIHMETVRLLDQSEEILGPIVARLEAEAVAVLGEAWASSWREGLPEWDETPGGVNIPWILRLRNLALAYDMMEYGKMRYNMLGNGGHWFPGNRAENVYDLDLTECLSRSVFKDEIPAALEEAHALLSGQDVSRLQQD